VKSAWAVQRRAAFLRAGATLLGAFALLAGGCATEPNPKPLPGYKLEALRSEALRAAPPVTSGDFRADDLVEPAALDPTLHLDVRYATHRNFLQWTIYPEARVFLQRPAAEAVVRANRALRAHGYGLVLYDGYRPWYVTRLFWDATPPERRAFVADPAQGSRHNRGCAIDLGLYELATGRPVPMPSDYDEFSERAHPAYTGGTTQQRAARDLLRATMEGEGFSVNADEWWHYDYRDWPQYRIGNAAFKDLRSSAR
jgi:zinc D-Ala-D-Ala dipeptidase